MLNEKQRAAAVALLAARPEVVPGTRAIINAHECRAWYDEVTRAMGTEGVITDEDVNEFCNTAGVPD